MSLSIGWRPKAYGVKKVSDELRRAFVRHGYQEGYISGSDILWLEGCMAAGVEDAAELIRAIEKHGAIELVFEY